MRQHEVVTGDRHEPRGSTDELYRDLCRAGDEHAEAQEYAGAERCYRQAAVVAPREPAPYVGLGVAAMHTDQPDKAMRAFQTACSLDPTCGEAFGGIAMLHLDAGRYPQAFETYLKCLELDADNLLALLGLFQTSCRMGTFAKIIHYLEAYLDKHPDDHSVLFCLGTLYAREGQLHQAKQALLTVLSAEPDKPEARELLQTVREELHRQRKDVA